VGARDRRIARDQEIHQKDSWSATNTATEFVKERDAKGEEFKAVITVDNGGTPIVVFLVQKSGASKEEEIWWRVQLDPDASSGPGAAYVFAIDQKMADRVFDTAYPAISVRNERFSGMFRFWRAFEYKNAFVGYDTEELLRREKENEKKDRGSWWRRALRIAPPRPRSVWWHGGSAVLLRVAASEYVFIGERVIRFKTAAGDSILRFVSDMGRSAVPYPYAVGRRRVYLMSTTMTMEDAKRGKKYVPIPAPIVPPREDVPSPLSPVFRDPYDWLWRGENRERGDAAKQAGVLEVQGFRELLPRL